MRRSGAEEAGAGEAEGAGDAWLRLLCVRWDDLIMVAVLRDGSRL